jgi:hypothetical protein
MALRKDIDRNSAEMPAVDAIIVIPSHRWPS